jgi:hypothetical protein
VERSDRADDVGRAAGTPCWSVVEDDHWIVNGDVDMTGVHDLAWLGRMNWLDVMYSIHQVRVEFDGDGDEDEDDFGRSR